MPHLVAAPRLCSCVCVRVWCAASPRTVWVDRRLLAGFEWCKAMPSAPGLLIASENNRCKAAGCISTTYLAQLLVCVCVCAGSCAVLDVSA